MAPFSESEKESPETLEGPWARVKQVIEMKAQYGAGIQSGVVAILDEYRPSDFEDAAGLWAMIQATPSSFLCWKIAEVRDHGRTISLFFSGMDAGKLTVGCRIAFPTSIEGVDRAIEILLPPGRPFPLANRSA